MITEDYVSFETAKLLKEKKFNELVPSFYGETGLEGYMLGPHKTSNSKLEECFCARPTHQMVMKWLREKCIFITLDIISFNLNDLPVWSFDIWHNNSHEYWSSDYFDSYEQACEAAIKYCLKHLL